MIIDRDEDAVKVVHTSPQSPGIEAVPPFDMTGATDWERQQLIMHWREACRAALAMMDCGQIHLGRLHDTDRSPGDRRLTGGGGGMPVFVANQLVVALTALNGVYEGMTHRLAVAERDS